MDVRQRHAFVEQTAAADFTYCGFESGEVNTMFLCDSPGRQQGLACSGCGLFAVDSCMVCANCNLVATDLCMNIEAEFSSALAEEPDATDWVDAPAAGQLRDLAPLALAPHPAPFALTSKKSAGKKAAPIARKKIAKKPPATKAARAATRPSAGMLRERGALGVAARQHDDVSCPTRAAVLVKAETEGEREGHVKAEPRSGGPRGEVECADEACEPFPTVMEEAAAYLGGFESAECESADDCVLCLDGVTCLAPGLLLSGQGSVPLTVSLSEDAGTCASVVKKEEEGERPWCGEEAQEVCEEGKGRAEVQGEVLEAVVDAEMKEEEGAEPAVVVKPEEEGGLVKPEGEEGGVLSGEGLSAEAINRQLSAHVQQPFTINANAFNRLALFRRLLLAAQRAGELSVSVAPDPAENCVVGFRRLAVHKIPEFNARVREMIERDPEGVWKKVNGKGGTALKQPTAPLYEALRKIGVRPAGARMEGGVRGEEDRFWRAAWEYRGEGLTWDTVKRMHKGHEYSQTLSSAARKRQRAGH